MLGSRGTGNFRDLFDEPDLVPVLTRNSFPIIWQTTRGGPGHETSTTTTFMYLLEPSFPAESAAMSVSS